MRVAFALDRRAWLAGGVALLAVLVAPLVAAGQPTRPAYRIGYLETGEIRPRAWEAFKQRLRELGYVEGRTVTFEIRCEHADRPPLAAEKRASN
jgi:hypothetical protein